MPVFKWGIICTVNDVGESIEKDILEFFSWLLPEISSHANELRLIHEFEPEPMFFLYSKPGEKASSEEAYALAEKDFPRALFVFHILPYRNSKEYNWMKEMSQRHWQMAQGILIDSVHSRFDGAPVEKVCNSMNQYISRRMLEFIRKRPASGNRTIYVNSVNPVNCSLRKDLIADSVRLVLHNSRFISQDANFNSESTIIVSGYPPSYSNANIAALFGNLHIKTVQPIRPNAAFIEFENGTQAVQALVNLHGYDLGAGYYLELQPTSDVYRQRFRDAKQMWKKIGCVENFPYA